MDASRFVDQWRVILLSAFLAVAPALSFGCGEITAHELGSDIGFWGKATIDIEGVEGLLRGVIDASGHQAVSPYEVYVRDRLVDIPVSDNSLLYVRVVIRIQSPTDLIVRAQDFYLTPLGEGSAKEIIQLAGGKTYGEVSAGERVDILLFGTWEVDQQFLEDGYTVSYLIDVDPVI